MKSQGGTCRAIPQNDPAAVRSLKYSAVILLMAVCASCPAVSGPLAVEGRQVIQSFDYHNVSLEQGELRRHLDEVRSYYVSLARQQRCLRLPQHDHGLGDQEP